MWHYQGVKTYSDPLHVFRGVRTPQPPAPMIHAPGSISWHIHCRGFFLRATVLYRRCDISPRGCRALPVRCLSDSAAGRTSTTCVGGDLTKLRRYRQTERLDSEATMDADRGRAMDYRPVRQPVTTGSNRLSIFRRTEIRLDV